MSSYIEALRAALRDSLLVAETLVTEPSGLAGDVRALRQALFPDSAADLPTGAEPGEHGTRGQGLAAVSLALGGLAGLRAVDAVDQQQADHAETVLRAIQARLGVQVREEQARKLRGLYVIIDPATTLRDPEEVAAAALRGGACAIQWRDKLRDKGDQLPVCQRLTELCARHDALFIVNDHADLARACGAHGLHLGQHDLPLAHARPLLAADQLVGRSNATVEEATATQGQGADYIAVGAIFPTDTKANTRPAGLETLRRVRTLARVPIVAIGGIDEANAGDVIAAGADAVAVISAVAGASDPEAAATRLNDRIQAALATRGPA